jgi:hypothetical protein
LNGGGHPRGNAGNDPAQKGRDLAVTGEHCSGFKLKQGTFERVGRGLLSQKSVFDPQLPKTFGGIFPSGHAGGKGNHGIGPWKGGKMGPRLAGKNPKLAQAQGFVPPEAGFCNPVEQFDHRGDRLSKVPAIDIYGLLAGQKTNFCHEKLSGELLGARGVDTAVNGGMRDFGHPPWIGLRWDVGGGILPEAEKILYGDKRPFLPAFGLAIAVQGER